MCLGNDRPNLFNLLKTKHERPHLYHHQSTRGGGTAHPPWRRCLFVLSFHLASQSTQKCHSSDAYISLLLMPHVQLHPDGLFDIGVIRFFLVGYPPWPLQYVIINCPVWLEFDGCKKFTAQRIIGNKQRQIFLTLVKNSKKKKLILLTASKRNKVRAIWPCHNGQLHQQTNICHWIWLQCRWPPNEVQAGIGKVPGRFSKESTAASCPTPDKNRLICGHLNYLELEPPKSFLQALAVQNRHANSK